MLSFSFCVLRDLTLPPLSSPPFSPLSLVWRGGQLFGAAGSLNLAFPSPGKGWLRACVVGKAQRLSSFFLVFLPPLPPRSPDTSGQLAGRSCGVRSFCRRRRLLAAFSYAVPDQAPFGRVARKISLLQGGG